MNACARERAVDVVLLAALKAALGAWVLHVGFTHVSDDDYARVVIAELFAHQPKLDPSGTSWLPFPFWMTGGAMMLVGRSLETARLIGFALGAASVAPVYLTMRALGMGRRAALLATGIGMATPWNAWLGVATVPEAITGSLIAAGALAAGVPAARPWAAWGLGIAALSRYEAWPVCSVFALAAVFARRPRGQTWCAGVAVFGPIAWMLWNAHAHDGALHFLRRVTAYKNAVMPSEPLEAMAVVPQALLAAAPEIVALAFLGLAAVRHRDFRQRWALPLVSLGALVLFLVIGEWRGGAPTHHPERALVAALWILSAFGVDGLFAIVGRVAWRRSGREAWVAAAVAGSFVLWFAYLGSRIQAPPGTSAADRRDRQIALGRELAISGAFALEVVPCAYEHFALLAAFGAPERASIGDATGKTTTGDCPQVVIRQGL